MINLGSLPRIAANETEAIVRQTADGRPAIITGLVENWRFTSTWTEKTLAERLGDVHVRYRVAPSRQHPQIDADGNPEAKRDVDGTLGEYLRAMQQNPRIFLDGNLTCLRRRRGAVNAALAELEADIEVPPFLDTQGIDTVGIWLSGQGVQTRLHYDRNGRDNFNGQILGDKTFVLFSPDEIAKLYPIPIASDLHNFTFVNNFAPDFDRFPLFAEARGYRDRLRAGEMLFIPAYWYHSFEHLGAFNFNLNFWCDAENLRLSPVALRAEMATVLSQALGGKPRVAEIAVSLAAVEAACLAWATNRATMDEIGVEAER